MPLSVKKENDIRELRIKELENHTNDLKAKLSESQKIIESNNSSKKKHNLNILLI